jgi:hypothetical protein
MRIYSETYREECDVFGISISLERARAPFTRITFYVKNPDMFGLGTADFSSSKIIDDKIGKDFRFHLFERGDGIMLLWDHFDSINHLARLIDLDPDAVGAFENALRTRYPT